MKIFNHSDVIKTYDNAEKSGERFIRDRFLTVPEKGIFLLTALLSTVKGVVKEISCNSKMYKDIGLQFSLLDTRIDRKDNQTGKVYRIKSFNILLTGRNLLTGRHFSQLPITATDDLTEVFLKSPKTSVLCQSIEMTSNTTGNKYLRLEVIESGEAEKLIPLFEMMKEEGVAV